MEQAPSADNFLRKGVRTAQLELGTKKRRNTVYSSGANLEITSMLTPVFENPPSWNKVLHSNKSSKITEHHHTVICTSKSVSITQEATLTQSKR